MKFFFCRFVPKFIDTPKILYKLTEKILFCGRHIELTNKNIIGMRGENGTNIRAGN